MDSCKFTKEADKDIVNIHEYTIINFGYKQALKYSRNLYNKIESLANKEVQGRRVSFIKKNLRKLEVGSHIVLYKEKVDSILIVRILHNSMDVKRHI